jgi:hypothetical protein
MSWHLENRIFAGIKAAACLVLFGGLAAYLAWAVAATIHDGTRAQSWVRVQARVVDIDFARATYRYEWEGRKFAGDRAGSAVFRFASELDDWDDRMEALVTAAQQEEKPILVLVNPSNPSESMINNEIRWAVLTMFALFAFAFGAGGLGGAYVYGRRALGPLRSRNPRSSEAAST